MTDKYEEKYLKYKQKYLELKSQIGGLEKGNTFEHRVTGKKGVIVSKIAGTDTDIKYNVIFDGETEVKVVPRSEIKPTGWAAAVSAAKLAKKKAVIGAKAAASATASAARSASETYKTHSPGVFSAVKRAASSAATTVSNAASATHAAVTNAVAPATPAGDVNAQIKSILDASEY